MNSGRLKVLSPEATPRKPEPTVNLTVAQVVPLLVDAYHTDRAWLTDFGDDSIRVSNDLYEILLAYQQLRRSDAA